ncbi:hypothetical protein BQ8794_70086 [Mesorhizobium prunaredense]|uniref:Uncharacterized protein n=1 Tax=Mesorhizobium prunaredense TaxID=1631249 RepID=A0A1R3VGX0_9HYPH|nr:hypothetical protein BQ8794_70086 [Mesorhizobium prunaredense]
MAQVAVWGDEVREAGRVKAGLPKTRRWDEVRFAPMSGHSEVELSASRPLSVNDAFRVEKGKPRVHHADIGQTRSDGGYTISIELRTAIVASLDLARGHVDGSSIMIRQPVRRRRTVDFQEFVRYNM